MPRPRRFTSAYGHKTLRLLGSEQYTYRLSATSTFDPGWILPPDEYTVWTLRSVRLHPVKSDYKSPTPWGMFSERFYRNDFDYKVRYRDTGYYRFRGTNGGSLQGINPSNKTMGTFILSDTSVIVNLPDNLSARAMNAARIDIADKNIDVSVFFGELRETATQLLDLTVRIARSLRHARKGRWRRAAQALNGGRLRSTQHLAENYAGYVWGLVPLINDAYGLQQQIKDGFKSKNSYIRSVGFASKKCTPSEIWNGTPGNNLRLSGRGSTSFSRVVYTSRIHDSTLYALNQLGLANPIATAWELVPLSFVIDWFLPIGDFLTALTSPLGTEFVSGFEDRVIEASATGTYLRESGFSGYLEGTPAIGKHELFAFQRVTLGAYQPTAFYFGSGLSNSVSRVISSLALLKLRS